MRQVEQNKYQSWYNDLMAKAKERLGTGLIGYTELHHIKPRSLDGSNNSSNLVNLTYREHFIAHWLLTKFTVGEDKKKMQYGLWRMTWRGETHQRIVASWQYELARKSLSISMLKNKRGQGKICSEEKKEKISRAQIGKVIPTDSRLKMRLAKIGKTQSAIHVEKRIAKLKGVKRDPAIGRKISLAKLGHVVSEETRAKISETKRKAALP